jgi:hypothetical protein
MATPASLFRAHGLTRDDRGPSTQDEPEWPSAPRLTVEMIKAPPAGSPGGAAVEFEVRVPPSGAFKLVPGKQQISVSQGLAGRTLIVWADLRSIHLVLDGHLLRTIGSRLLPEDLQYLAMRGARRAGPEPAIAALPRVNGTPVLGAGQAVEVDRKVNKDGNVQIAGTRCVVGFALAGRKIMLRLDGHLMHAISDNALVGTWPCPVTADRLARLPGVRQASTPLRPPPLPAGSIRAHRRVHASGRIMVAKQALKLGPRHAGKLVTVVIEDTTSASCTAMRNSPSNPDATPHRSPGFMSWANTPSTAERQGCPDNKPSRMSRGLTLTPRGSPTRQGQGFQRRELGMNYPRNLSPRL